MLWILYNKGTSDFNVTSVRMSCAARCQNLNFTKVYADTCKIIDDTIYVNGTKVDSLPDIIFTRCYNYDVLDYMQAKGVKIVNDLDASKRARSKWETYIHMQSFAGITQPLTYKEESLSFSEIVEKLGLPFVMKNNFGSLGKRCYLVKNKYQYSAIKRHNREVDFIVQKFEASSFGKDIRVYVIGEEVIGSVIRKSIKGDFRANISLGGIFEPFDAPQKLKDISIAIARHCNLEICGLDFLFGSNGEFVFCEINANAGFLAFSRQGVPIRDMMMQYLDSKYHRLIAK